MRVVKNDTHTNKPFPIPVLWRHSRYRAGREPLNELPVCWQWLCLTIMGRMSKHIQTNKGGHWQASNFTVFGWSHPNSNGRFFLNDNICREKSSKSALHTLMVYGPCNKGLQINTAESEELTPLCIWDIWILSLNGSCNPNHFALWWTAVNSPHICSVVGAIWTNCWATFNLSIPGGYAMRLSFDQNRTKYHSRTTQKTQEHREAVGRHKQDFVTYETKCHQSFPKPNNIIVPKFN